MGGTGAMGPRLLLTLLSLKVRQSNRLSRGGRSNEGYAVTVALLVAFGLTIGTLALASYFSSTLLAIRGQSSRTDALATAEAGMNRVMSTFNQPVNRKFLVSGQKMKDWSSADLTSPCRDSSNNSPGAPTTEARNYGDGQFRALDTLETNTGTRQFRVTKVTYSAGKADDPDRRSESITTTAKSDRQTDEKADKEAEKLATTGSFNSDLINLNDPAGGDKYAGYNKGYFTVTIEAKVVEGGKVSTATLTREYEVLPRCCGASFGSNGSGGSTLNNANALGADSRFCGVEFGAIMGLNNGTTWQYEANDRYTKRLSNGTVAPITNVIGIVSKDGDEFNRKSGRMRPNSASTTTPDPCDPLRWNGGKCQSNRINYEALKNPTPTNGLFGRDGRFGTQADVDGTAMSGIPIIPAVLTLPTIGSELVSGQYNFSWNTNEGASARVTARGGNRYPVLNPAGASGYQFRFRTRNQAAAGFALAPVIEVCNQSAATLGGSASCTSASNWSSINRNSSPIDSIEDFSTITLGTWTNSTALSSPWIGTNWFEIDNNAASTDSGTGLVQLGDLSGNRFLQIGVGGSMGKLQNGVCRAVDLSGNLGRGMLSFDQSGTNVTDADELWVQVSTSGAANSDCSSPGDTTGNGKNIQTEWITIAKFPGVTKTTPRIVSLADYQANPLRIRLINGTATNAARIHIIDNINASISDWCQYSAASPVSSAPGFHCLGPQFNLTVNTSIWTSSKVGGQVYIDASGGPVSFYYTRTDDYRGNSYSFVNPTNGANPIIAVDYGGFIRTVKCTGIVYNCTQDISESDVALVGDPDNLNFFGRDSGTQQVIYFGVVATSTGAGRISGVWFYMPVGYFELRAPGCGDYNYSGPKLDTSTDTGWILSSRIWTQHFKPCGDIHFRVPPSSGTNLNAVAKASLLSSGAFSYVPWTGTDWVARAVTQSRSY